MSVEEKLEFLMQEVCQTKQEVEEKLESLLGQEVNAAQEKMTQDVPWEHQLPVPQKRA